MEKRPRNPGDTDPADETGELRCDFCGQIVPRVRRIALDRDYERLQTPHAVRYACEPCSTRKERKRLDPRRA
jgi:hypothetical protein